MLFLIFISSGLLLGWSLGSNDAANIFGTAVGSRMISFRRAAWIASIFVVLGAVFQGRGASETLTGLGEVDALGGAFTVALFAGFTVFLMTRARLPVSTSQAVVGAILGWTFFTGSDTDYSVLTKIVSTWVSGPVLGMIFAAILYILLRKTLRRTKIHVIKLDTYIRIALIMAGAFGAYSLGANNIANVMGVFVPSAPDILLNFGIFTLDGVQILFLLGGLAIAVGIFTYSERVMQTVGRGILALTPEAAFIVVLAQALVLFLFSSIRFSEMLMAIGLPPLPLVPVSSTQVVIGAVLGIGLVKGAREIKIKTLSGVALGWIITPITAGTFTFFALFFVQNVFGIAVTKQIPAEIIEMPAIESEPSMLADVAQQINMVLPGLLILSMAIIVLLVYLFFRLQKKRLKTENELLTHQNQYFNAQKALNDMEINAIQMENTMLSNQLEIKRQEYNNILLNISDQKKFLESVSEQISRLIGEKDLEKRDRELKALSARLKQRMSFAREIDDFYGKIEQTHRDFIVKLTERFPDLTEKEKRLAILLRLNLSSKEIATLMNISTKSAEIARYRLRKKIGLKERANVHEFLTNL